MALPDPPTQHATAVMACAVWLARDFLRTAGRPIDIPPCAHDTTDCPPIREGAHVTTTYRSIPYAAQAIRWTGDNFDEVRQFLNDNGVEDDCIGWDGAMDEARVFQFYAWNDDQEVDLGRWIVIDNDPRIPEDDRTGQVWTDDEFRMTYEPAAA